MDTTRSTAPAPTDDGQPAAQDAARPLSCPRAYGRSTCPGRAARKAGAACGTCGAAAFPSALARRLEVSRRRHPADAITLRPRSVRLIRVLASLFAAGPKVITTAEGDALALELRACLDDLEGQLGGGERRPPAVPSEPDPGAR